MRTQHRGSRRRGSGILLAAALGVASACGDGGGPAGPESVHSVEIAPLVSDVWLGDQTQLVATVRSSSGAPLAGREVSWSTSSPETALVHAHGLLEAVGPGTAVITATSEGRRGELEVVVGEAELMFEGYRTGLPELFVLSLRGGEPERVLPPHTVLSNPVPSPDGSRILFVLADYVDWHGDIYVVNRDGSGLQQLTFSPELDDQPAWSPDGTRIAFRSYRLERDGDIWVMDADGSNPTLLTPDPLPGVTDEMRPSWSPDGARIAYVSNAGGSVHIWTMRADGSDKRQLTNTKDFDTEPWWSPDGKRIVFRRAPVWTGETDLMIIAADGGEAVALPIPGVEVEPAWSPDGRLIAFTALPAGGGQPQLYTVRPDGTDVTLRTWDWTWNGGRSPRWYRRTW